MKTLIKTLDLRDERLKQRNKGEYRGEVVATNPMGALVRVGGSQNSQQAAILGNIPIEVGDMVLLQRNMTHARVRWVISGNLGKRDVGSLPGTERPYRELFPPTNLQVVNAIPNAITVQWDAPVTLPVAFELQWNYDPVEDEYLTTLLITRGSYAIILNEPFVYVRVRSIAPDGQTSAWSDWLEADQHSNLVSTTHHQIEINYTDTTRLLLPVIAGTLIKQIDVVVSTVFNAAASLVIGEPGNSDRLMQAVENDLTQLGTYTVRPLYTYTGVQTVNAILTTSATDGVAQIYIHF